MKFLTRTDVVPSVDWEGIPCEADISYVVARDETGRQWAHFNAFRWEDEAQEFADKIADAVSKGRELDLDNWTEMEPSYGSQEFQRREAGAGKDRCPDCHDAHRLGIDALCRYHGGEG